MSTAATLLSELRRAGATVTVAGDKLRIEAPDGTITPELHRTLADHKAELLALLERTLPPTDPRRLTLADCVELLDDMHAGIRANYPAGALSLLNTDRDLRQRFEATEARIDDLAKVACGPTESDFRAAIKAHADVWRELIARYRAHRERQTERPDPMPELPKGAVLAIGMSYGDGQPGTWDVVRQGRKR
jgi:hypothetical protein